MSQLTLVAKSLPPSLDAAQFAHDIRNVAATVALHVDTLERAAGPCGEGAASAAHDLISKLVALCNDSLKASAETEIPRRVAFDITGTVRQIVDLLAPLETEDFGIHFRPAGTFMVLGDAQQVFRIIFNLAYNAVTVARHTRRMTSLEFVLERDAASVTLWIIDDGPGLPDEIQARLFRKRGGPFAKQSSGYGIAIARELAERNGGMLRLVRGGAGTSFVLTLSAQLPVTVPRGSGRIRTTDDSHRAIEAVAL